MHIQQGPGSRLSYNVPTYCGRFESIRDTINADNTDLALASHAPGNTVCAQCIDAYDAEVSHSGAIRRAFGK